MKVEYDFSNARPNPYAKSLKKQITININEDTVAYFKTKPKLPAFRIRRLSICI